MIDAPTITQTTEQPTAVVRLTIPKDAIMHEMGPARDEVLRTLAAQGATAAGPWFSRHFRMDPSVWDFEVGVPVATPIAPTGRVTNSSLPAARVARTNYRGGYEGLVAKIGPAPGLRSLQTGLGGVDAVLARIIPSGTLEQIIFRVDALHRLDDRGIRVVNSPRAIERTVDKFWTSALLEQCGLPTPETIVCENVDEAFAGFRALGDVIVKPLFGSMGLGMARVSDEEMAYRVFRTIEQIRGVYYLQRAIDHDGADVRAFVIGNRVVGAIERRSNGWRTNLARGGTARSVSLADDLNSLALRAASAVENCGLALRIVLMALASKTSLVISEF